MAKGESTSTTKKKASKKTTAAKKTTTKKKVSAKKSVPAKKKKRTIRTDQRVPIQLLVDYKSEGHYLFDFCKDLGTGGVFIQTKNPLPKGSTIDLTFTIPDSKETLQTKGKVLWVQDIVVGRKDLTPGMGVQFSNFGNEQRKILENFVKRYHSDEIITTPNSRRKPA